MLSVRSFISPSGRPDFAHAYLRNPWPDSIQIKFTALVSAHRCAKSTFWGLGPIHGLPRGQNGLFLAIAYFARGGWHAIIVLVVFFAICIVKIDEKSSFFFGTFQHLFRSKCAYLPLPLWNGITRTYAILARSSYVPAVTTKVTTHQGGPFAATKHEKYYCSYLGFW